MDLKRRLDGREFCQPNTAIDEHLLNIMHKLINAPDIIIIIIIINTVFVYAISPAIKPFRGALQFT